MKIKNNDEIYLPPLMVDNNFCVFTQVSTAYNNIYYKLIAYIDRMKDWKYLRLVKAHQIAIMQWV